MKAETFKSLYIHIPFCLSKCAYCDFFSKPVISVPDSYIETLLREISFRLENNASEIETVYIGGGTPSLLTKDQIKKITGRVFSFVKKEQLKEFTFEVNPDDVTPELLKTLSNSGVTRISCGIQSATNKVLEFCKRRADRKQVFEALSLFKKYWKGELSLDLISALPYETEESFMDALETVTRTGANHISMYSLTFEDETPFGKMLSEGKLDYDFEKSDEIWIKGRDFLFSKGFSQYEVSNFCKNEKVSFHNLSYWNRTSYIGCGSGATGTLYYSDGTAFRWTNTTDLSVYCSAAFEDESFSEKEKIDVQDGMFEFFMMGLRKLSGVSKNHFMKVFGKEIPEVIQKNFSEWKEKGLAAVIQKENDVIYSLTEDGILFLNTFLEKIIQEL